MTRPSRSARTASLQATNETDEFGPERDRLHAMALALRSPEEFFFGDRQQAVMPDLLRAIHSP
jgi:hypothetical protein